MSGKMPHLCDHCFGSFSNATDLLQHIQASCLSYYKKHPASWTRILSNLGPDEEEETKPEENETHNTRSKARPSSSRSVSPAPEASRPQTPSTSSQSSTPDILETETVKETFKCKCGKIFTVFNEYSEHGKGCSIASGKEPPFCIMFRAQNPEPGKQLKNVHMTVNDYFYGVINTKPLKEKKIIRRNNCYSCSKTLRNNIRFMSHLRHKVLNEWGKPEEGGITITDICNHCFRRYESPFHLQCHLETVHSSQPAACTCGICELNFSSEKAILFHMKDKHVHNELPYVCKVCGYRSSFYNDVTKHFRDVHVDTSSLMCPFCLCIHHTSNTFLKHVIQHIKKGADCPKCRLQFVSVRDRAAHMANDHNTNIIRMKKNKFKNLGQCQVFVRVSSLAIAQPKQTPPAATAARKAATSTAGSSQPSPELNTDSQKTPKTQKQRQSARTNRSATKRTIQEPPSSQVSPPKKPTLPPTVELPEYLCPLKRSSRIRRVRTPKNPIKTLTCWECRESFPGTGVSLRAHFHCLYECRWCVYVTSCKKAADSHVLREHADAELREELLRKKEAESQSIVATVDDSSSASATPIKTEPDMELSPFVNKPSLIAPKTPVTKEKTPQKDSTKKKGTGKPSWKGRRKQPNPMKIADEEQKDSPKIKRSRKQLLEPTETEEEIIDEGPQVVKEYIRPGVEIQPVKHPQPPKKSSKKILAPPGYFPDLNDDEGWAKYFEQCEGGNLRGKKLKTPEYKNLPTMVPQPAAAGRLPPLQPLKLKSQVSTAMALPDIVPTMTQPQPLASNSKFLVSTQEVRHPKPAAEQGGVNPNLLTGFLAPLSGGKALLPTTSAPVTTNNATGPVYTFQLLQKQDLMLPNQMQSNRAEVSQAIRMASQVPQMPVNLRCLEATHSSLLVQWQAPLNCLVTHYKVIFQGSGAPTVQLLPPEQTLVRLVGLKSDTMYVIRVYSLCNKAVSQYAFLYQKTKKLRADPPRAPKADEDDVVLVIDDGDTPPQGTDVSRTVAEPEKPVAPEPDSTTNTMTEKDREATQLKAAAQPYLTEDQKTKAEEVFKGIAVRTKELKEEDQIRKVVNDIVDNVIKFEAIFLERAGDEITKEDVMTLLAATRQLATPRDATKYTRDATKSTVNDTKSPADASKSTANATKSADDTAAETKKAPAKKQPKPDVLTDLGTDVKSYLAVEKAEKRILINNLLEGLKKNKKKIAYLKSKAQSVTVALVGTSEEGPQASGTISDLSAVIPDGTDKVVPQPTSTGIKMATVALDGTNKDVPQPNNPGIKMVSVAPDGTSRDMPQSNNTTIKMATVAPAGTTENMSQKGSSSTSASTPDATSKKAPQPSGTSPNLPAVTLVGTRKSVALAGTKITPQKTTRSTVVEVAVDGTKRMPQLPGGGSTLIEVTLNPGTNVLPVPVKATAIKDTRPPTSATSKIHVISPIKLITVDPKSGATGSKLAVAPVASKLVTEKLPQPSTKDDKEHDSTKSQGNKKTEVVSQTGDGAATAPDATASKEKANNTSMETENTPEFAEASTKSYKTPEKEKVATVAQGGMEPAGMALDKTSKSHGITTTTDINGNVTTIKPATKPTPTPEIVKTPDSQPPLSSKASSKVVTARITGSAQKTKLAALAPRPIARKPTQIATAPPTLATRVPRVLIPVPTPIPTPCALVPINITVTKAQSANLKTFVVSDISSSGVTTLTALGGSDVVALKLQDATSPVKVVPTSQKIADNRPAASSSRGRESVSGMVPVKPQDAMSPIIVVPTSQNIAQNQPSASSSKGRKSVSGMVPVKPQDVTTPFKVALSTPNAPVKLQTRMAETPSDVGDVAPQDATPPGVVPPPQNGSEETNPTASTLEGEETLGKKSVVTPPKTSKMPSDATPPETTCQGEESGGATPQLAAPQQEEPDEDCDTEFNIVNVVSLRDTATEEMPQGPSDATECQDTPPAAVASDERAPQNTTVTWSQISGQSVTSTTSDDIQKMPLGAMPRPLNQHATATTSSYSHHKIATDEVIVIDDGPMLTEAAKSDSKTEDKSDCIVIMDDEKNRKTEATATSEVDDAINKELVFLGGSPMTSSVSLCGNVPTLDDIKDIMNDEMGWLK